MMDSFFKALNDPTRREILEMLRSRDMSAGEIADAFEFSKPTISHHLDLLRQAGLVESAKQGQYMVYSLSTTVMDEIVAWFMEFSKNKKTKPKK